MREIRTSGSERGDVQRRHGKPLFGTGGKPRQTELYGALLRRLRVLYSTVLTGPPEPAPDLKGPNPATGALSFIPHQFAPFASQFAPFAFNKPADRPVRPCPSASHPCPSAS